MQCVSTTTTSWKAGPAQASQLLRHIRKHSLPPVAPSAAREILSSALPIMLSEAGLPTTVEPTPEMFVDLVLNIARERYPGRLLPGHGLDLLRCAVTQAETR